MTMRRATATLITALLGLFVCRANAGFAQIYREQCDAEIARLNADPSATPLDLNQFTLDVLVACKNAGIATFVAGTPGDGLGTPAGTLIRMVAIDYVSEKCAQGDAGACRLRDAWFAWAFDQDLRQEVLVSCPGFDDAGPDDELAYTIKFRLLAPMPGPSPEEPAAVSHASAGTQRGGAPGAAHSGCGRSSRGSRKADSSLAGFIRSTGLDMLDKEFRSGQPVNLTQHAADAAFVELIREEPRLFLAFEEASKRFPDWICAAAPPDDLRGWWDWFVAKLKCIYNCVADFLEKSGGDRVKFKIHVGTDGSYVEIEGDASKSDIAALLNCIKGCL